MQKRQGGNIAMSVGTLPMVSMMQHIKGTCLSGLPRIFLIRLCTAEEVIFSKYTNIVW